MSPRVRACILLSLLWTGTASIVTAGSVSLYPTPASSRDRVNVWFYESDWYSDCAPPVFDSVEVTNGSVLIRLARPAGGCTLIPPVLDTYSVHVELEQLPPGTYLVEVEAPDYTTGDPEVASRQLKVDEALQCGFSFQPAATVLLPYFEVDVGDPAGVDTVFSVASVAGDSTLAHAVIWSNWGTPVLSFDFFIPADGLRSFRMRDLLAGNLPATSPPTDPEEGFFAGCTDPLTLPEVDVDRIVAMLTGRPTPGDELCFSEATGDGLATGYVTVDVVRDCSGAELVTPFAQDYFLDGGAGLGTNDNVLWGDFFLVDPANDFAQGEQLVTVVADASRFGRPDPCAGPLPCTPMLPTFYFGGDDNRMPLPKETRSLYLTGGGFLGQTDLLVFTHYGTYTVAECDQVAELWEANEIELRSRGQAGGEESKSYLNTLKRVLRIPVGGDEAPVAHNFGTIDLTARYYFIPPILPPPPEDLQTWVIPLIRANGRFSVGTSAIPLADFCRQ